MSNWSVRGICRGIADVAPVVAPGALLGVVTGFLTRHSISVAEAQINSLPHHQHNETSNEELAGFVLSLVSVSVVGGFALTAGVYLGYKTYEFGRAKFAQYQARHERLLTNNSDIHEVEPNPDDTDEREVDLTTTVHEKAPFSKVDIKTYGEEVISLSS